MVQSLTRTQIVWVVGFHHFLNNAGYRFICLGAKSRERRLASGNFRGFTSGNRSGFLSRAYSIARHRHATHPRTQSCRHASAIPAAFNQLMKSSLPLNFSAKPLSLIVPSQAHRQTDTTSLRCNALRFSGCFQSWVLSSFLLLKFIPISICIPFT